MQGYLWRFKSQYFESMNLSMILLFRVHVPHSFTVNGSLVEWFCLFKLPFCAIMKKFFFEKGIEALWHLPRSHDLASSVL